MPILDLLQSQLTDVLRIGLIVGLVVTTLRNAAVSGKVLPLMFGVVFVAVIIPVTKAGANADPLWWLASVGVAANLIILAAVLGIWTAFTRYRR